MKRLLSFLISMAIVLGTFPSVLVSASENVVTPAASYADGDGSVGNPYQIETKEQLAKMAADINAGTDNNAYFVLTEDIDYGSAEWTPIGSTGWDNSFRGNFDGQGHVIKNLKITGSPTYAPAGLFGYVGTTDGSASVSIKNLGIENMELTVAGDTVQYAGGLAGIVHVKTTIENCYVKNSKIRNDRWSGGSCDIGGFVGVTRTTNWHTAADAPLYKNCYVYGVEFRASAGRNFGGFAGYVQNANGGTFENCFVAETTYAADFLIDDGTDTGNRVPRGTVYGFVNDRNLTGVEVNNCYSTIESVQGKVSAAVSSTPYDETKNAGTTSASKDAIVNYFKDVDVFGVDETVENPINDGYPALRYEDPTKLGEVPTTTPDDTTTTPEDTVTPAADYADGDGSVGNPYQIATKEQLAKMATEINGGTNNNAYFVLTADIDYEDKAWIPIGSDANNWANSFKGSFDGQGYVISNLSVTGDTSYAAIGLFGYVGYDENDEQTVIKNVGIEGMNVNFTGGTAQYVGGLVGYLHCNTTISNCYVKNSSLCYDGDTAGNQGLAIGGFAGMVRNHWSTDAGKATKVENSYVYDVTFRVGNTNVIGGFVGTMNNTVNAGKFHNCYAAELKYDAEFMDGENHKGTVYGFANGNGKDGIIAPNCYSTLAGGVGSASGAAAYTESNEIGTSGAEKDDILTAFENVEAFGVLSTINDGYPCLVFEDASLMPTPPPEPSNTKVNIGELQTTDNGDGTTDVSIELTYTDLEFDTITFTVVVKDEKGDIIGVPQSREVDVSEGTVTVPRAELTVTIPTPAEGNKIYHYLCGDDNVSLIDNAPNDIKNFSASSKAMGIRLTWDPSADDSGNVAYKIYKDGTLIDTVYEATYLAPGSLTTASTYKVIPVDPAEKTGASATSSALKTIEMDYINPTAVKGLSSVTSDNRKADAYSVTYEKTVEDEGEEKTYTVFTCDIVPNDVPKDNGSKEPRFIYFSLNNGTVSASDAEVVFEIDYLDIGTEPLQIRYNGILSTRESRTFVTARGNTNKVKTARFKVTNAKLSNSTNTSGASFGVMVPVDAPAYSICITEVRICKASEYGDDDIPVL